MRFEQITAATVIRFFATIEDRANQVATGALAVVFHLGYSLREHWGTSHLRGFCHQPSMDASTTQTLNRWLYDSNPMVGGNILPGNKRLLMCGCPVMVRNSSSSRSTAS